MKETGIVRNIDELGRIVVPSAARKRLGIKARDELEISVTNDSIVIRKYEQACMFCGSTEDNIRYKNKRICRECLEKINEVASGEETE